MIYKNKELIVKVQNNISQLVDQIEKITERNIGAIYKGSQLLWLTIYDIVKSCFGSGIWLPDKFWLDNDTWKNN